MRLQGQAGEAVDEAYCRHAGICCFGGPTPGRLLTRTHCQPTPCPPHQEDYPEAIHRNLVAFLEEDPDLM